MFPFAINLLDNFFFIRRWEKAFLKIRKRNDELLEENREHVDSPNSPKFLPTDEVVQLRDELKNKDIVHNERIIEMVSKNYCGNILKFNGMHVRIYGIRFTII